MGDIFSKVNRFRMIAVLIAAILIISGGMAAASGQSIIDEAKKEKKLSLYTSMNVADAMTLLQEFKKKYPFITTEIYRSKSIALLNKIPQETKAKRYTADVITSTFTIWNDLKKEGQLMKYRSPESLNFPAKMKDPEDYWTVLYLQIQGMAYNTRMVSAKTAPQKYEDLLIPAWKGGKKIAMDYHEEPWFAVMLEIMGKEKGLALMKKLSEQTLYLRDNKTLLTNLLVAGEFPVLANTYMDNVIVLKRAGAPVEWVPGYNPIPASTHLAGIYAYAPHPNVAKLYIDFLLSHDGQKLLMQMGNSPVRSGVDTDLMQYTRGFDIHPVNPSMMAEYSTTTKLYREIFWKQ